MAIPLKALIVDDSPAETALLIDQLRQGGYEPTYTRVETVEAMQQAFTEDAWDIVLADYTLLHFSGPAALQFLKQSERDIPFIVVSGTVTEQQAIDMMRDGASDFILKQNMGRLVPAIRRELRESNMRRERRHALEELREREQRLSFVIDHSPDNIFIQDADLRYIWVSKPAYPLTIEEYIDHTDFDIGPREEAEHLTAIKRQVMREGHGVTVEVQLTLKGQPRVFDATYEPWKNADGHIIGIAGYVRDITQRVETERALERERAFLSSAIELLPFPIIFNTPEGEVIRANQAGYQFFGDLAAANWWNRQLLDSTTRQPISRESWPMMVAARGDVVPATNGILVLPNGREVDVLAVAAPIYLDDTLVATVVAFMDITEIKEADRAKTRFLAMLSHQLRTPLTNILGWAKEAREVPDMAQEALQIIHRNADEQRRMLENLLEMSRFLHGKFDFQRQSAELWPIVMEAVQTLKPEASERHITITLVPPEQALPVLVDRKRLREAIENVVENAVHFSDTGGHITVHGEQKERLAVLTIQDDGQGISPDQLPHVLELFHVSPTIEQTGAGLGLGLPLAKVILDRHGGSITVSSAGTDQGTTVVITVPLME
ncbi:MAG TPA: ATP-binding protein [Armatimonadota bacterium]|nr:ATP-binding protein [Armatimonadota bacterium]